MNVFQVEKGIRKVGLNYGVSCILIDCGIGVNYSNEELLKKLVGMGLRKGSLVVIRDGMGQRGIGAFVSALKYLNMRVEVEAGGGAIVPGWFPEVTFWLVRWIPKGLFNYSALRPRQDLLVYGGDSIEEFIENTKSVIAERGIIGGEVPLDLLYTNNIRYYKGVVEG